MFNSKLNIFEGGSEDKVLTFEEDQVQDHTHEVNDPGHSHMSKIRRKYTEHNDKYGDDGDHIYGPTEDMITSSDLTGISVNGVTSSYRHGEETRPKNMRAIFIMRVY